MVFKKILKSNKHFLFRLITRFTQEISNRKLIGKKFN